MNHVSSLTNVVTRVQSPPPPPSLPAADHDYAKSTGFQTGEKRMGPARISAKRWDCWDYRIIGEKRSHGHGATGTTTVHGSRLLPKRVASTMRSCRLCNVWQVFCFVAVSARGLLKSLAAYVGVVAPAERAAVGYPDCWANQEWHRLTYQRATEG